MSTAAQQVAREPAAERAADDDRFSVRLALALGLVEAVWLSALGYGLSMLA
jgi:hypothetical protein